jgi:penicillin-binding protein 1A
MALGDYGIPPIEHAGGLATFANGGKSARPYAILDMVNSKGEMVYSREKDEPEPQQLVSLKVAEGMNQMMQKVVTDGTAQLAALDFTNVVGKTGTSTGPTDNWFVGFTGKYVGSVWLGNDDNRPMASGNTGGHMAAPLWHSFMSVAHRDMNIPTIPGLQPHPVQVAEQQRIAELKRTDPAAAAALTGENQGQKTSPIMSDSTRDSLKRISGALRKAAGMEDAPDDKPAAAPAQNAPNQPPKPPGNKADAGPAINGNDPRRPVAGMAAAGMNDGEPR